MTSYQADHLVALKIWCAFSFDGCVRFLLEHLLGKTVFCYDFTRGAIYRLAEDTLSAFLNPSCPLRHYIIPITKLFYSVVNQLQ